MPVNTIQGPENQLESITEGLAQDGYAVTDHFLSDNLTLQLLERLQELQKEGELKKAGIGKQQNFQIAQSVRGDYIKWIDSETARQVTHVYLEKIEALMKHLNRTCFLGLKDYESHFAVYPTGTFYKRHADRFQQNPHRIISFVFYMNPGWTVEDGGMLRLYLSPEHTEDVVPVAGRLTCFRSEIEHEVLPAHKTRYSITGWMLDQINSLTFL